MELRGSRVNKCPNLASAYFLRHIQLGRWHAAAVNDTFVSSSNHQKQTKNHSIQRVLCPVCMLGTTLLCTLPNFLRQICLLNILSQQFLSSASTEEIYLEMSIGDDSASCSLILFPTRLVWREGDLCPMSPRCQPP